jgi:negative regulator of flagellin synthesis FlgM
MKVEKPSKPAPVASTSGQNNGVTARPSAEKPSGGVVPASGKSADVQLSSMAAQMQTAVADAPMVDAAKVEQVKQAISSGQFQVDSGAVADRMIQTVTDLIKAHANRS